MPKRDMDLIRTIMLHVEALEPGHHLHESVVEAIAQAGTPADSINYHLILLRGAGYLDMSPNYTIGGLTWAGHDFLDAVRDPDVWAKTKERVLSVGAWTFDIVKDVAMSIVKDSLKEMASAL